LATRKEGDELSAFKGAFKELGQSKRRLELERTSLLTRVTLANHILKRTFRLPSVLPRIDTDKVLFPHGVLSVIKESKEPEDKVKRIEIFAEDSGDSTYGILRNMFVAFSSERKLLDLAHASDNVIEVRTLQPDAHRGSSQTGKIIGDKLVLKRTEQEAVDTKNAMASCFSKAPNLLVPSAWLEKVDLDRGAQIMVSNPIERYMVPPPTLCGRSVS
jgi:hypothetical protein